MPEATVKLDGLIATAKLVGEGIRPWQTPGVSNAVYVYDVQVTNGEHIYATRAWGSAHDFEQNRVACEEIAWMVLDELSSAANDPDEFWQMVVPTDEAPTRERVESIFRSLDAGRAFANVLGKHAEEIAEHN